MLGQWCCDEGGRRCDSATVHATTRADATLCDSRAGGGAWAPARVSVAPLTVEIEDAEHEANHEHGERRNVREATLADSAERWLQVNPVVLIVTFDIEAAAAVDPIMPAPLIRQIRADHLDRVVVLKEPHAGPPRIIHGVAAHHISFNLLEPCASVGDCARIANSPCARHHVRLVAIWQLYAIDIGLTTVSGRHLRLGPRFASRSAQIARSREHGRESSWRTGKAMGLGAPKGCCADAGL